MQIYDGAFDFWDAVISRGEALFSFPSGGGTFQGLQCSI